MRAKYTHTHNGPILNDLGYIDKPSPNECRTTETCGYFTSLIKINIKKFGCHYVVGGGGDNKSTFISFLFHFNIHFFLTTLKETEKAKKNE